MVQAMGMMWGGSLGMGLAALLGTVVVLALSAVAVVVVLRALGRPVEPHREALVRHDDWSAEEELRRRYARGDIDSEEFRRRMRDLTQL